MTDEIQGHICDFCCEWPAEWYYPTDILDFQQLDEGASLETDSNNWFACIMCAKLIENVDLKGLVERALAYQMKRRVHPIGKTGFGLIGATQVKNHLYQMYTKFWNHRKGVRKPYDRRVVD